VANVLSLAMKINADASGFKLDPVQRALIGLGEQADKVTAQFDKFKGSSESAAAAQERLSKQAQDLLNTLRDGGSATEYAVAFERLTQEARDLAAAFEEGARVTDANRTAEERRATELAKLERLLEQGAIGQETYNRAVAQASGANEAAAAAERNLASQRQSASRIIEANLTNVERAQRDFDAALRETQQLEQAGLLTAAQANAERQRQAQILQNVTTETQRASAAAKGQTLQFNELSGIFAALPGPLGNIAGRISGLSSAGEGLSRVFAGGLSQGISGVASSLAGLVNPVTAALAGITAFAAGATAIARGLTQLEDRVENLGNIADKLGVSFGFIQTLEEAANRSGTSIDAVSAAFGRLQKSVLGVDEESKAAQKALAEIGVTAEELQALSPEEQYRLIGESLAAIEDPARRTATATALFGKSGADLLPFFRNLGGAAADMERFGRALTDIDRQRIDDFGAGIDALGVATQGLGQSLLLPFAGLGEGVAKAFAEITAGITAIVDPIGQVLEPVLTQIGRVVEIIGIGIGGIGRVVGAVFEPFATVAQEVSRALEPLYDGVVNIFRTLSDSQVAVTEWLVSFTPIGAIAENAAALGETLGRVVTIITTAFSKAGEFVGNLAGRFGDLIAQSPLLRSIGETVSSVFGGVSSVFQTISQAIGGTVGRLLTMAERFLGIDRSAKDAAAGVEQVAAATEQVTQLGTKSQEALNKAIDQVGEYGQAGFDAALKYQEALRDVDAMIAEEGLTEEQAARARAQVTAEYERQMDVVKQASDEKKRAADEAERAAKREADAIQSVIDKNLEQIRIDREFGGDAARARNADDLAAIRAEIAKTEQQIAEANAKGDEAAAARAAARLAQLDQVEARLAEAEGNFADRADQTAQGFADGFDKAFATTTRGLDGIIDKAAQFGNEGAKAAQQLQEGIARAQEQVRAGILSKDAYEAEVANQRRIAEERLGQLDREAKARQAQLDAEFQQQVAANERINQFLLNLDGGRQRAEAEAAEQAFKRRQEAAENLKAIEDKIALQRKSVEAAREQNDLKAAKARQEELRALERIQRQEKEIAEGRGNANRQLNRAANVAAQAQLQQQQVIADTAKSQIETTQRAASNAVNDINQAFAAAADAQRQLFKDLNTLGSRTVQTADVRTQEGAAIVLGLAVNAQDPRLIEQRLANKILRQIATGLTGNLNRIGIPAQLL
jgi:hypothetical protein